MPSHRDPSPAKRSKRLLATGPGRGGTRWSERRAGRGRRAASSIAGRASLAAARTPGLWRLNSAHVVGGVAEVEVEQVSVEVLLVDVGTCTGRQPGQRPRVEPRPQVALDLGTITRPTAGRTTDIPGAARTMMHGSGSAAAMTSYSRAAAPASPPSTVAGVTGFRIPSCRCVVHLLRAATRSEPLAGSAATSDGPPPRARRPVLRAASVRPNVGQGAGRGCSGRGVGHPAVQRDGPDSARVRRRGSGRPSSTCRSRARRMACA